MAIILKLAKLTAAFFIFAIVVLLQSCGGGKDDPKPVVVQNEDVFINEVYSSGDDWLELYNADNEVKDVGGYAIYDDVLSKYRIPIGTSIQPKGFLILLCDGTGTGLHTSFKLSSSGESVYLENATGKLIDKVEFPALSNGQSYARIPDGSVNIVVNGNATQGTTNGEAAAPAISSVNKSPLIPAKDGAVTVTATVIDNTGIASVKLFYRLNGGAFESTTMTLTTNSIYEGAIPAAGEDGSIEYYIEAKNTASKTSFRPSEAPTKTYSYLINSDELPQLVINEFMAANVSCCADADGDVDEFDDWIEIYNAGDAIDIAGMYLSDDPLDPFKFKVPDTNSDKTTIPAGGYLIIWADESQSQGELHANFKLSNQGESVGLYYIDGRTIDQKTFGLQNDDNSYGRISDGAATWQVFSDPTQGTSNQ